MISVIIPAYNAARTIAESIESVQRQTYPVDEIIVVDDGSTDETVEMVRKISGVKMVVQENQGVSVARNHGVSKSHGDYIAFLDADDLWHPQKIEIQMEAARQVKEFGIIGGLHTEFSGVSELLSPLRYSLSEISISPVKFQRFLSTCFFGPPSALIPRKIWEECGGFNPRWISGEDRDLWLRIASRHPVYRIELPLFYCRTNQVSNLSNKWALSGHINEPLILEQWHPTHGCFTLPAQVDYRLYRRVFFDKVYLNAKRVLRHSDEKLFSLYWDHFAYVFGKKSNLIYWGLCLKKWSYNHLESGKYPKYSLTPDIIGNLKFPK